VSELKDCPFCGASEGPDGPEKMADGYGNITVMCECGVCTSEVDIFTDEQAITRWNTRTDGWISVEDRLPFGHETVIVRGGCGYYNPDQKLWYSAMANNHLGYDAPIQWTVTHWMELEPPK